MDYSPSRQVGREFLARRPLKMLRKAVLTAMLAQGLNRKVVAVIVGHDPAELMTSYTGVMDQRDVLAVWMRTPS